MTKYEWVLGMRAVLPLFSFFYSVHHNVHIFWEYNSPLRQIFFIMVHMVERVLEKINMCIQALQQAFLKFAPLDRLNK